jgi:hypothetical protein
MSEFEYERRAVANARRYSQRRLEPDVMDARRYALDEVREMIGGGRETVHRDLAWKLSAPWDVDEDAILDFETPESLLALWADALDLPKTEPCPRCFGRGYTVSSETGVTTRCSRPGCELGRITALPLVRLGEWLESHCPRCGLDEYGEDHSPCRECVDEGREAAAEAKAEAMWEERHG